MPFFINPHRHVKIWLSDDQNSFMNQVNRARLMLMRAMNPHDVIHLIYDSRLLTTDATASLKAFCAQHHLRPKDAKRLLGRCSQDAYEPALVALYEDNIRHLGQGGNLGAASDILRVLEPVWSLGIYSDMDVVVHTDPLPPMIAVDRSVLLNIGSIERSGFVNGYLNTDIFAVADAQDARRYIDKIQGVMVKRCSKYAWWNSLFGDLWSELAPRLPDSVRTGAKALSAREMRALTEQITRDNERLHYLAIRKNVMETSGPEVVGGVTLAGLRVGDPVVFRQHVAPLALGFYPGLRDAFRSGNHPGLFATEAEYQVMAMDEENGRGSDASWTPYARYLDAWRLSLLAKPVNVHFSGENGSLTIQYPDADLTATSGAFMPESEVLVKLALNHIGALHTASESLPANPWDGRRLVLSDCYVPQKGVKICLETRASFFAASRPDQTPDSPVSPVVYQCVQKITDTTRGTECTGDTSVRLRESLRPGSAVEAVTEPAITPDFAFRVLGSAALKGGVSGFMPGFVADGLYLSGFASRQTADYLRFGSQVLLAMLFTSWTGLMVMLSVTLVFRVAGVSPGLGRAAGLGVAMAVSLGDGPLGAVSSAAGMAGSFFGSLLERRLARTAESLLASPELPELPESSELPQSRDTTSPG